MHRLCVRLACLSLACSYLACSSDEDDSGRRRPPPSDASTDTGTPGGSGGTDGSGGASTGGSGGSTGGTGGASTGGTGGDAGASTGGSAGGDPTDASGGSSGAGDASDGSTEDASDAGSTDAGADADVPLCSTGRRIWGELAGNPIDEVWTSHSIGAPNTMPWELSYSMNGRGYEHFWGTVNARPLELPPGDYALRNAILLSPTTSSLEHEVVCLHRSRATKLSPNGWLYVKSETATLLGACPGTRVSGSLALCSNCLSPGSVDGTQVSFVYSNLHSSIVAAFPEHFLHVASASMVVRAFPNRPLVAGQSGAVAFAIIVTTPQSPLGGGVYCAGSGSTYENATANGSRITLNNLSRLGTCGVTAGSDTIELCR